MKDLPTWREWIELEMARHGESFQSVVACSIPRHVLDTKVDGEMMEPDRRISQGFSPWTVWTQQRVYFPVHAWEGGGGYTLPASAPRNPDGTATPPIGGCW